MPSEPSPLVILPPQDSPIFQPATGAYPAKVEHFCDKDLLQLIDLARFFFGLRIPSSREAPKFNFTCPHLHSRMCNHLAFAPLRYNRPFCAEEMSMKGSVKLHQKQGTAAAYAERAPASVAQKTTVASLAQPVNILLPTVANPLLAALNEIRKRSDCDMQISRRTALLALASLSALPHPAQAVDVGKPILTDADVPLAKLLALPPTAESAQTKAEIAAYKSTSSVRTDDLIAFCKADDTLAINHFLAAMSLPIDIYSMAQFKALFESIAATTQAIVDPAKTAFNRARPAAIDLDIKLVVQPTNPGSYPSLHATAGFLYAILLSEIAPEKRSALFDRAAQYGYSRYYLGLNYPTDIEAGRSAAAAIAVVLFGRSDFQKQMIAAKTELRPAIGL